MKNHKFTLVAIFVLSVYVIASSILSAQEAKKVVLADFVSAEELYQRSTPFPYSTSVSLENIWGWTYQSNEYALICLGSFSVDSSGLAMVKVTDPNKVQYIKTIKRGNRTAAQNGPADVEVFNNYAYVGQNVREFYYVDLVTALNNPSSPSAGVQDFPVGHRVHNLFINTNHGLLFLADLDVFQNFLNIYDINTLPPDDVFSIQSGFVGLEHDVFASDNRLYVASNDKDIVIIEYSYDKPTKNFDFLSSRQHRYNGRRGQPPNNFSNRLTVAHNVWPSTNGNYLFGTDERNGNDLPGDFQLGAYLRTWDISNIDTMPDANTFRYPIRKAYQVKENSAAGVGEFNNSHFPTLTTGEFGTSIHNVHIRNESGSDIAYMSYYTEGLRILDVTNPLSPTEVGYYDVPNLSGYVFPVFAGSYGAYPFFSSNTIVVSDARGLFIFRRATEVSGTISSNTTWSGAIFITNSITVSNNATLTISQGTTVAFADGKSLTVNAGSKIIADGTSTQTIKFTSNSHPPARSKWGSITLYSTGNVFDYCTFEYGGNTLRTVNAGAVVSNSTFHTCNQALRLEYSNVSLSNCDISNSFAGVTLVGQNGNNNNSVTIYNCHIHKNDRSGITAVPHAHAVVKNSHLQLNGTSHSSSNDYHGVYVDNNGDLTFYDYDVFPSSGLNTIRLNEGAGVYSKNSTVNIGNGSSPSNKQGDNAIFGNGIFGGIFSGKQVYNAAGATVFARYTYWGQGQCPPPSSFFSGNVDRANCLTTSPTGISKIMAGNDSTFDAKTFITQHKGYLLDQSGAPVGFDSLSTHDALALYFSMIRNDFEDLLQERSQADSVLQYVYNTHKGDAAGDKAFQSLVGYEMIYGDWSQAEILCEQALIELTKASHADMLATLVSLELKLGKFTEAQQHFDDYALAYPQEEATIQTLKESFETAEVDYENGWKTV